jgi:hypothetical protein
MAAVKKAATKTKMDWKILAGSVVILAVLAYVLVQVMDYVSDHSSSKYEKAIGSYYLALSKQETNTLKSLITSNFTDELALTKLDDSQYTVFSYQFENIKPVVSTNSNQSADDAKLLFGLSYKEGANKVSYIAEAYFAGDRIDQIKKMYKGKNITAK